MEKKDILKIVQNKKFQLGLTIAIFLIILILSSWIRFQNLPLLVDETSGEYIPLALDPFYFLRIAETLVETDGNLPEVDGMRSPHLGIAWHHEILPQSIVLIYRMGKIFNPELTLRFADIISPVIFFILGLVLFFLLSWKLSGSKSIALISSGILAIIPPYLYRTLAGFSDHESIGMFSFFLTLLLFSFGMFYLDKKKSNFIKSCIFGALSGLATLFAIVSWSGGAKFLFMILPLTFLITWIIKKNKNKKNYLFFYLFWIVGVLISAPIFGLKVSQSLSYMLGSTGILTFFALGYALVDFILIKYNLIDEKFKKWKELINFGVIVIVGGIVYQVFVGNFFGLVGNLIKNILYPFGVDRVSLTVAENKQPYLNDWILQIGKFTFYTFLVGCFIVGAKISKGIKVKKFQSLFTLSFAFFIVGILFSRISESSILNGQSFLSKALFFISFLILFISSVYIYKKSEWDINTKWILIVSWMIPMLFAVRSATRVFFAIVPFVSFLIPLAIFEVGKFAKKSKDELIKMFTVIIFTLLIIGLIFSMIGFYKTTITQAKYTGPSANVPWQKAMSWVRDNTSPESIFLHWWDYGYWVQTLGERATVSDGGHSQTAFGDHLIGRYVLTTPNPKTAKSFMTTHNVSYLLIDPTDIGKYPAYSSIGSDETGDDRNSWIMTMLSNPSEIQETREGMIRTYQGGFGLDGDLYYKPEAGKEIFLPREKSIILGTVIEFAGDQVKQPEVVYLMNGNQIKLPIRYLYFNNELFDFKVGINSTIYLYPSVYPNDVGQEIDQTGAVMYLSEKVKDSLVAKLYLMNDPEEEYSNLELVYDNGGRGMYYYGGFVGPIKIFEFNGEGIEHKEFKRISGKYAEFDYLFE